MIFLSIFPQQESQQDYLQVTLHCTFEWYANNDQARKQKYLE